MDCKIDYMHSIATIFLEMKLGSIETLRFKCTSIIIGTRGVLLSIINDTLISWALMIIRRRWMRRWPSWVVTRIMVIIWSCCCGWRRAMWWIMSWMRGPDSACVRYYRISGVVSWNSWIDSMWRCCWRSVYMWRHSISCRWISTDWHSTSTWWTWHLWIIACRARPSWRTRRNWTCEIFYYLVLIMSL